MLVMLRHPNVVNIYGIIDDDLQCLQLIMDFASGGDLRDFFKSDSSAGLSALEQLDLCNQIANGMEYLHSKQVAHRDLKSLNVLVFIECTGERVPKISDFSRSKMDHGYTATATAAGPLGNPAVECARGAEPRWRQARPFSVRHVEFRCGGVGSNNARDTMGGIFGDASE